ncbi:hypothetical protein KIW84_044213 [Lathyrus oleraceus]|uniref:PB1-like domain-containing protein n=1 Tax=Pisum sativum TaxID=3888 RepID=A0A9D5AVL4_PEA|nr:hypothetical protein KIW84_044213 [Pisum sativum]
MQHFNVILHHGGEFIMVKKNYIIHRGGVDTLVSSQHIEKWTMSEVRKLVNRWGYKEGSYRLWMKILEIDEDFFQIRKDGDAYDFGAYAYTTQVDGDIYLKHDANDIKIESRPKKKIDDDEYCNDGLDNLDLDESSDDERLKFEKFRKEKLSKDYKFK